MVAVTARPLVGGKRCPFVGEMKRGGERATSQVLTSMKMVLSG